MRYLLRALLVASAVVVTSAQSGIDGKWMFEMESPMGSVTAQVELKAAGSKLTGQFDMGGGRTWPIQNGTIEGDSIKFTLDRDGNMTYDMSGKLAGDKITGVAAAMGTTVDWGMARAK